MVILRPTRKLRELVPESLDSGTVPSTALGDWYANRIVVDRQPLVLLISSLSLLSVLIRARAVKKLPDRLPRIVKSRLLRMEVPAEWVAREGEAMSPVRIAKTVDRSVLGSLVDFAKLVPYYLPEEGWDDDALLEVEDRLSKTPCRVARGWEDVIFPGEETRDLLATKWS